jgi:hypothetical protein
MDRGRLDDVSKRWLYCAKGVNKEPTEVGSAVRDVQTNHQARPEHEA